MERDKKNPMLALALALLLMVAGSLLALLHVGMSARGANQIHYSFNTRGASLAASTYAGDIGRGAAIAKARTAQVLDNFFGGDTGTSGTQTASAGSYSPQTGGEESSDPQEDYTPDSDAFTKYYEKHYGKGAESGNASWNEGGGFSFGGGGGGGGGGDSATSQSVPENSRETASRNPAAEVPAKEPVAKDIPAASFSSSGGAAYSAPKSSLPQAKGSGGTALSSPPPPLFPGQGPSVGGGAGAKGMKTGGLDGFNNKAGAADLDSGLERASSGAKSDYGAKMSGGAAATAAAGAAAGGGGGGAGGGAGSPVDASKDGKGAAGSKDAKGKDAGSSSPVFGWWNRTEDEDSAAATPAASAKLTASADPELLKAIVTERRNGGEAKYLTEEDEKAAPEETLLKSGAVALTAPAKEKSLKEAEQDPDPEDFSKLSAERKAELKKEIHSFLKRVENKYGKMTDIEYTACKETPDFCKEHGLERSYLTMTTANKASLVMGVKYVKDRWRRYTVDFKRPAGTVVPPANKPDADPSDEPVDDDEYGEDEFYE